MFNDIPSLAFVELVYHVFLPVEIFLNVRVRLSIIVVHIHKRLHQLEAGQEFVLVDAVLSCFCPCLYDGNLKSVSSIGLSWASIIFQLLFLGCRDTTPLELFICSEENKVHSWPAVSEAFNKSVYSSPSLFTGCKHARGREQEFKSKI